MKDKLTQISDDLNHNIITEKEAREQLLVLCGVVGRSEQFICSKCDSDWGEIRKICFNCEHEEDVSK